MYVNVHIYLTLLIIFDRTGVVSTRTVPFAIVDIPIK